MNLICPSRTVTHIWTRSRFLLMASTIPAWAASSWGLTARPRISMSSWKHKDVCVSRTFWSVCSKKNWTR